MSVEKSKGLLRVITSEETRTLSFRFGKVVFPYVNLSTSVLTTGIRCRTLQENLLFPGRVGSVSVPGTGSPDSVSLDFCFRFHLERPGGVVWSSGYSL